MHMRSLLNQSEMEKMEKFNKTTQRDINEC